MQPDPDGLNLAWLLLGLIRVKQGWVLPCRQEQRKEVPCVAQALVRRPGARLRRAARPRRRRRSPALAARGSCGAAARRHRPRAHARPVARGARGDAAGHGRRPRTSSPTARWPTAARWCATCWRGSASRRSTSCAFVAANDYYVDIPTEDFTTYDAILAMEADGERLSRREKGPLWLMYPISRPSGAARPDLPAPADLAGRPDRGALNLTDDARPIPRYLGSSSCCGHGRVRGRRLPDDPQGRREPAVDQPGQHPVGGLADGDRAAALPAEPGGARARTRRRRRPTRCSSASTSSGAGCSWWARASSGESLMRYDGRNGSVARLGTFLKEIDPAVTAIDPGDDARLAAIEAALADYQARAAPIHAPGDPRRRRRRGAGARPASRRARGPRRSSASRRCWSASLALVPDPAREPPPPPPGRAQPPQRRAGGAGEPRQVAVPHHDEPRAAQSAERRPRAAGAARPERHRRSGTSGWSTRRSSPASPCSSC